MIARRGLYSVALWDCAAPEFSRSARALGSKVEPDRALVAVDADEIGRVVAVEGRSPVAHLVAGGRLDLDHVGTMVGEDLRAVGSAEHAREIDYAQSAHRAGVIFGRHGSFLAKLKGIRRPSH